MSKPPEQEALSYRLYDGLNSGGVRALNITPRHFQVEREREIDRALNPQNYKPVEAFRIGSAVDNLVLDPPYENRVVLFKPTIKLKKNGEPYAVQPTSLDTEEGREFIAAHKDSIILTEAEWPTVERMAENILNHPVCRKLIRGGVSKNQIFTEMQTPSGKIIPVKAEIDYLRDDMIIDLKTTADLARDWGSKARRRWGYHIQAVWYQLLAQMRDGIYRDFAFVVCEKSWPHEVKVFRLKQETRAEAYAACEKAMELYAECRESGIWPGYEQTTEEF